MTKGEADYLALGDWNATCYMCGRKFKASLMRKNWQGFWTCPEDWEPRQPQDFVRNVPDIQTPPWVQPPPTPIFVLVCFPNGRTAYPDFAIPDCVTPDWIDPYFNPDVTA